MSFTPAQRRAGMGRTDPRALGFGPGDVREQAARVRGKPERTGRVIRSVTKSASPLLFPSSRCSEDDAVVERRPPEPRLNSVPGADQLPVAAEGLAEAGR
jgi:hypothetical protein